MVLGTQIIPLGMPTLSTSWLEVRYSMHWLEKGSKQRGHVCFARKKLSRTIYVHPKCNMTLCVMLCFKIYNMYSTF